MYEKGNNRLKAKTVMRIQLSFVNLNIEEIWEKKLKLYHFPYFLFCISFLENIFMLTCDELLPIFLNELIFLIISFTIKCD